MSDESDDDWFEKALSEDEDSTATGDNSGDETEAFSEESAFDQNGSEDAFGSDADGDDAFGDSQTPWDEDGGNESDGTPLDDEGNSGEIPWDEKANESDGTPWDEDGDSGETPWDEDDSGDPFDDSSDDPFGGDSSAESAFGDESGGGAFGEESGGGSDSPWGDESDGGGGTPWGDDTGGDSEGLFDDEGFGGFDSGGDSEFDDEDFESEIPRIDLGIEGLDNMIQGGVPEHHLMVTIGSAGTGKTTFGLQFLNHGLEQGDNAVFITLEQSHEAIIATANEFGWEFESFEDENRLAVVDLDPVEMANSLDNIQAELPELIRDFDADRLVLDSVSLLEMMYDSQAKRRTEVFDFTRALKKAGVTTFFTSEASESNAYASRHGIIEYLTDAVFVLQYVRGETQETRLAVEIQKIRNANHSREKKPYEMGENGLSVYQQANIF